MCLTPPSGRRSRRASSLDPLLSFLFQSPHFLPFISLSCRAPTLCLLVSPSYVLGALTVQTHVTAFQNRICVYTPSLHLSDGPRQVLPGASPPRLSLSPFTPPPLYSAHPSSLLASSAGHASLSALCKHGALVRARTWPAFALFTLAEGIGGTPAVLRKRKHVLNGCLRDSRGDVSGARAGPSRVRPHARASQGQKKKKRKGETKQTTVISSPEQTSLR